VQLERNCYQAGSLRKVARKKGQPVWEFRYRNNSRPGNPMRQVTLSTVEYPTEARARIALQPMLLGINSPAQFKTHNVVTVGTLIDRFILEERISEIVKQRPGHRAPRRGPAIQYGNQLPHDA